MLARAARGLSTRAAALQSQTPVPAGTTPGLVALSRVSGSGVFVLDMVAETREPNPEKSGFVAQLIGKLLKSRPFPLSWVQRG